jgi:alpha-L-fucosidase 2
MRWLDQLRTDRRGLLAGAAVSATMVTTKAWGQGASSDHELWYRAPAEQWEEALPVGNGRIGAMVFGGIATERLQLNEDTLWAGGPYDPVNPSAAAAMPRLRELIFAQRYAEAETLANERVMARPLTQAPYQTVGSLIIEMPGLAGAAVADYRRALDLDSAVAVTEFTVAGVRYRREVLASPVDQVVAVRLSGSRGGALSCRLSFACPLEQWRAAAGPDGTLVLSGSNDPHAGIPGALRFEARMKAVAKGGRVSGRGGTLVVEDADELVLLIAMATSHRRFDDVAGRPEERTRGWIAAAQDKGFRAIADAAAADHRRLYRRVGIDLGRTAAAHLPTDERIRRSQEVDDPALAALYFNYGRYLLIASSRLGSQPANLQGIWNEHTAPPWGSKYTININTEMNYWPAQVTGLGECVEPLIAMVEELAVTGAVTARRMYGARGWVAHHNTDLWRATAPIDGALWGLWPTGGAWLCLHLWEHYEYGLDRAYLERVYPVLHGAALFFLDTLQVDPETGHLVTNPSLSPELAHGHGSSLIHGPTMDMQILRDLFDRVAEAAGILGRDDATIAAMIDARRRLLPMRIGAQGQLCEWPYDWDADAVEQNHRHVSHLYGLYPSHQIDLEDTPELAAAARRSLELRGDEATGWATAWRINLWARLRDGARAHRILRFLLGPQRTYPNMFDAHPPFQIDGNFGGTAGIVEMLVQQRRETVDLLPALPAAWPSGSITGLRLRGGVGLDLSWRDGTLETARLSATQPCRRVLRYGGGTAEVGIEPGRPRHLAPHDFARSLG